MTTETNLKGRSTLSGLPRDVVRALIRKHSVHENVSYGKSLRVGRGVVVSSPHGLSIGDYVSIGPRSIVQVNGSIGSFALIGMGVQIVGRDDHAVREVGRPYVFSTWIADREPTPRDEVSIERDVWIGGSAVVLSGITIGTGALVASGSVVTSDVPPFAIVAGNPARVVAWRFEDEHDQQAHLHKLDELEGELAQGAVRRPSRIRLRRNVQ